MQFFKPKTPDTPEFAEAKNKLAAFQIQSGMMQKSLKSLSDRLKGVAQFYAQFANKTFEQWKDAPPAVLQANQCAIENANQFEAITNNFLNRLTPNVLTQLQAYDVKIKDLKGLEKKRQETLLNLEKKQSALQSAQTAKEPSQERISQCQSQCSEAITQFEQADATFLQNIAQFEEARKTELLVPFQNLMAITCQYLNQSSLLQPIPFPEDINGETVAPPTVTAKPLPPSKPSPVEVASASTPAPEPTPVQPVQPIQPAPPPAQPVQPPPAPVQQPPQPAQPAPAPVETIQQPQVQEQQPFFQPQPEPVEQSYFPPPNTQPQPIQPNVEPTPSYAYDAPPVYNSTPEPAPQPPAKNSKPKNPFDDDNDDDDGDGWGSNPFG